MLRAMVFIDFQNLNISSNTLYKDNCLDKIKIDYKALSKKIINNISLDSVLLKTYILAFKPCDKLLQIEKYEKTFNWLSSIDASNYIEVIYGTQEIRPKNSKAEIDLSS